MGQSDPKSCLLCCPSWGQPLPCEAIGYKIETEHSSGPNVHVRPVTTVHLGGCCTRLVLKHRNKGHSQGCWAVPSSLGTFLYNFSAAFLLIRPPSDYIHGPLVTTSTHTAIVLPLVWPALYGCPLAVNVSSTGRFPIWPLCAIESHCDKIWEREGSGDSGGSCKAGLARQRQVVRETEGCLAQC